MKIKELQKTVNITWSPAQLNQLYLAAGTAAQQIDTASSSATLEVYEIDLTDPGYDLVLRATQTSPYRFQKIVWSPLRSASNSSGIIAAGCESGHLQLYNAAKLLAGEDALVASQDKHTGAVRALDYNPFQANLLASGASESDIFIWDLNNTTTPMTPGTKTQPLEDIQNIAWNRQVQHILASVFSSRCVVWDLRKNEPIIKLSDSQSRVRFRALQWHPSIATQLWLASEDDQAPVAQLWDLRYATAPAKTLRIHDRGVLGLTWCLQDTDLMVSCGKDNKILCWNPNAEQNDDCVSEIASTIQWYSDVSWCPRNPALIASSSLDGNVSIYSLNGGTQHQVQTSNKIADSFPGMDTFAQAPAPQATMQVTYSDLKQPPKWMKRPVGAKFGFGGKLITFRNEPNGAHTVQINQVITEPELVERSTKLEEVLANGNFVDYCRNRADEMPDQHNRYVWYFLKANFDSNPHGEMLNLLGYNIDDIRTKFRKVIDSTADNDIDAISKKLGEIGRNDSSDVEGATYSSTTATNDSSLGQDIDGSVISGTAQQQSFRNELDSSNDELPYKIRTGDDSEGLICQALLSGNIESAVELCIEANRMAEAIIIAATGGSELLARTQYRYLKQSDGYLANIISALVMNDWSTVIGQCSTESWKEALVATLTHCRDHVPVLCEQLGERLQCESGNSVDAIQNAILCYMCAGNAERLTESWLAARSKAPDTDAAMSTKELQDLIEVVVLFQKALELQGRNVNASGKLAELLAQYAGLLAAQGALSSALTYLGPSDASDITELRERLYYTLGHKQAYAANVRNLSQTQNIYGNAPATGRLHRQSIGSLQPRTSIGSTGQPATIPTFNTFNNVQPAQATSPHQWASSVPAHPQAQPWNASPFGAPNAPPPAAVNPPVSQPPKPVATIDPLAQPPRPSSVSSQGSSLPRSKYILDPSVKSSSAFGQSYVPPPQPQTFGAQPQAFGGQPQVYGGQPQAFGGQPNTYGSALPPTGNHPQSFNQFNTQPFNPAAIPVAAPSGPPSVLNPTPVGAFVPTGLPPIELAQPAISQQPMQRNPTPPPGWNDPPALKSRVQSPFRSAYASIKYENMSATHAGTKKWNKIIRDHQNKQHNAPTKTTASSNPNLMQTTAAPATSEVNANVITHPLFATDPNQNQNQNGYSDYSGATGVPTPPNPNAPYQGTFMTPHLPPQTTQPAFQPNPIGMPPQSQPFQPAALPGMQQPQQFGVQQPQQFGVQQPLPSQQPAHTTRSNPTPEPPKPKAPLPEEYLYLQTVFNELRTLCLTTAANPQTKRKLDDVAKRLESLYDLLRDNRLTPNTLTSLNQLVQLVQIGDYANGLGLHTQMVSGHDFAQIASFMPGIKVLLQTAMQLQVYLR